LNTQLTSSIYHGTVLKDFGVIHMKSYLLFMLWTLTLSCVPFWGGGNMIFWCLIQKKWWLNFFHWKHIITVYIIHFIGLNSIIFNDLWCGGKKVFFLRYKGQVLIKHKRKKNVKCINNIQKIMLPWEWTNTIIYNFWIRSKM
jgi:hypothetical protein